VTRSWIVRDPSTASLHRQGSLPSGLDEVSTTQRDVCQAQPSLHILASESCAPSDREAAYPDQARRIAAAHAIQLIHTGIIRVPHGMVPAMGHPSAARANCKRQ
jgi:hypothetical protein